MNDDYSEDSIIYNVGSTTEFLIKAIAAYLQGDAPGQIAMLASAITPAIKAVQAFNSIKWKEQAKFPKQSDMAGPMDSNCLSGWWIENNVMMPCVHHRHAEKIAFYVRLETNPYPVHGFCGLSNTTMRYNMILSGKNSLYVGFADAAMSRIVLSNIIDPNDPQRHVLTRMTRGWP